MRRIVCLIALCASISVLMSACATDIDPNATTALQTTAITENLNTSDPTTLEATDVGAEETSSPSTESNQMSFPKTELMCLPDLMWGMSDVELYNVLDLSREDFGGSGYAKSLDGFNVLGFPSERIVFFFNGGYPRLSRIAVEFSDDTDMNAVKEELKSLYGNPSKKWISYALRGVMFDAENETLDEYRENLPEATPFTEWEADEHNVFWVSNKTLADLFEKNLLQDWIVQQPEIYQPYFREYAQKQASGCIFLSDNYGKGSCYMSEIHKNLLVFDSSAFAETAQELANIWQE